MKPKNDSMSNISTSPTGSENHLSPLRFQTFNRKVFWNRNEAKWFLDPVGEVLNIDTTSLLAVSSELFSLINIITLSDEANYSYQEFLNVLLHAATSLTNSLESASNDLRSKIPNIRIPSADTIFNYIRTYALEMPKK